MTRGAFHLVKNSENSGSGLNGKRFFGSPDRKIPRKSVTTGGAFHLVKNSENSGSGLNGKRLNLGSPGWKIPRKSGTA